MISKAKEIELKRQAELEACIPNIWYNEKILYIGANKYRFHYADKLIENNCVVDVIEIDRQRCSELKGDAQFAWIRNIFELDIRNIDELNIPKESYNLVLWSHGPTMLEQMSDVFPVLEKLFEYTNNLLVVMCPNGKYTYIDIKSGNEHDINKLALYEKDFKENGFKTFSNDKVDTNNSNLIAWKNK